MKNAGIAALSSYKQFWNQIVNGTPKHQFLAAIFLGSLGGLAFAPFNFYLILIPIFSGLLLLLGRISSPKYAFFLGWAFGFSYFTSGVFWVSVSFSKVGLTYLMPFVVVGFSGLFVQKVMVINLFGLCFFFKVQREKEFPVGGLGALP